jgi:hypothetical protein
VVQPINQSLLGFDVQTKKPSRWFWGPNHQTVATGFEAQIRNPPPPWFWGSTKKSTAGFEAKSGETVATSFEAKLEKTVATSFEGKPEKTTAAGFEAKPLEIVIAGFEVKPPETVETDWGQTGENRLSGFETKPLTNRRHRFW